MKFIFIFNRKNSLWSFKCDGHFCSQKIKKITSSLGPYISSGLSSTVTLSEASFLSICLEQNQVKKTKFYAVFWLAPPPILSLPAPWREEMVRERKGRYSLWNCVSRRKGENGLIPKKMCGFLYFILLIFARDCKC